MYILLDTACSTNVDSGACLINHIKKNTHYVYLKYASELFIYRR